MSERTEDLTLQAIEEISATLAIVATRARENDFLLLDVIKELITKTIRLEARIEELELLTRIVTTPPQ